MGNRCSFAYMYSLYFNNEMLSIQIRSVHIVNKISDVFGHGSLSDSNE